MRALILSMALAGCAAAPPPAAVPAAPACPPLPELVKGASTAERANHYAVVIRLYAQCAGAAPGDQ